MKINLWDYQKRAVDFIVEHERCALFLEMGLGKTVTTLTAISRLLDWGEVRKVLIVAPKKVAESTWSTETARWDHLMDLRVARVIGDAKTRTRALESDADVYVIGRDSYVWLCAYYKGRMPFDMLVIDELTSFKTPKSSRFKAMRQTRPCYDRIVGLTGTPAPNGLKDLWGQIYILDGGERLGRTQGQYHNRWFDCFTRNNIMIRCEPKKGAAREIAESIADICLTMKAEDYLQLPDLIEENVPVILEPETMTAYREFERENVLAFISETGERGNIIASSAAALTNKLAQFANGAVYDEEHSAHLVHDEKLEMLREVVESLNGEHVLLFYRFKHDAERIKDLFRDKTIRTYESDKDLQDWNENKIEILMAHPQSCAYGLNLQHGGSVVVWFSCDFNLELYLQANARLHRQGQGRPVRVLRIVCKGTIDEHITSALDGKVDMQEALIQNVKRLTETYG